MAKRGRSGRSWGTVKGSQIRQGRSSRRRGSRVRKAQENEFGGKSAETWSGIQLGEENPIADSTVPSRVKLFPLLPEPEGPAATTRQESQGPKGSHFRLSTATGTYIMTRRRALWNLIQAPETGCAACAGNWRANTSTAHALASWAGRKWPQGA